MADFGLADFGLADFRLADFRLVVFSLKARCLSKLLPTIMSTTFLRTFTKALIKSGLEYSNP